MFEKSEKIRYQKHFLLPEFSHEGQKFLKESSILIIGVGGIGSPLALYLSAMGIGTLGLLDSDKIELSNLHRQVLYTEKDVGKKKAEVMFQRIKERNSLVNLIIFDQFISKANLFLLDDFDLIVDATDNFETRYLLNDACYKKKKTFLSAAVEEWRGFFALFNPYSGPCYRCLFPSLPFNKRRLSRRGVLGSVPGLISMLQATEIVRFFSKNFPSSFGKVHEIKTNPLEMKTFQLSTNRHCSLLHKSEKNKR